MERHHSLREAVLFASITLGLSYFVFWGPIAALQIPTISFVSSIRGPLWAILLFMAGGFVPSVVALALTRILDGPQGLQTLLRRAIQFDLGLRWYLAVVLVVLLGAAGQILINALLGHPFNLVLYGSQLPSFIPLLLIGPISEEFGWRGYLLARLQQRWNALTSSIAVGVIWGLWHLPLFYMVGTSQHELHLPFAGFLVGMIALSMVMTWVNNNTQNSLWAAIFFHWLYTYAAQVNATGVSRSVAYDWLEYLPYMLIAAVVFVLRNRRSAPARASLALTGAG